MRAGTARRRLGRSFALPKWLNSARGYNRWTAHGVCLLLVFFGKRQAFADLGERVANLVLAWLPASRPRCGGRGAKAMRRGGSCRRRRCRR